MSRDLPSRATRQPEIRWGKSLADQTLRCQVRVPFSWMMESSHFKRKLQLWWWLTRLAWSIPK